ncbi:hypothetical protein Bca52824_015930 [Brassica carinata]|uniref:Uncharacterized protein n=1 Tax=Brassica carinata TaxID=52824 RepID=A0A8X8B628_BRACI|nr:hypothetical protein Bca52824_015930 [Brassica carinata]
MRDWVQGSLPHTDRHRALSTLGEGGVSAGKSSTLAFLHSTVSEARSNLGVFNLVQQSGVPPRRGGEGDGKLQQQKQKGSINWETAMTTPPVIQESCGGQTGVYLFQEQRNTLKANKLRAENHRQLSSYETAYRIVSIGLGLLRGGGRRPSTKAISAKGSVSNQQDVGFQHLRDAGTVIKPLRSAVQARYVAVFAQQEANRVVAKRAAGKLKQLYQTGKQATSRMADNLSDFPTSPTRLLLNICSTQFVGYGFCAARCNSDFFLWIKDKTRVFTKPRSYSRVELGKVVSTCVLVIIVFDGLDGSFFDEIRTVEN